MSLESQLCRESVGISREIIGSWLVDLTEQRIIESYTTGADSLDGDSIIAAALAWTLQEGDNPETRGVVEANVSAREMVFYFKATELARYSVVLATRTSMSAGIGWSMTRRLAARFYRLLQE